MAIMKWYHGGDGCEPLNVLIEYEKNIHVKLVLKVRAFLFCLQDQDFSKIRAPKRV